MDETAPVQVEPQKSRLPLVFGFILILIVVALVIFFFLRDSPEKLPQVQTQETQTQSTDAENEYLTVAECMNMDRESEICRSLFRNADALEGCAHLKGALKDKCFDRGAREMYEQRYCSLIEEESLRNTCILEVPDNADRNPALA